MLFIHIRDGVLENMALASRILESRPADHVLGFQVLGLGLGLPFLGLGLGLSVFGFGLGLPVLGLGRCP